MKGPNLLTGKKLLLADDSAAIQKVIDLTFSDEGMNVTAVGDGQRAWEELEQFPPPDVIIADVFMPGIGGLELCRLIKQNERLAQIPVMLLVSSFEPFDEGEARRAGADDIVTKPFQSIRQLVSRVASLVRGTQATEEESFRDHSTLRLESEMNPPAAENNATVLVEAPMMETHQDREGPACSTDIDLQTADTQQLERVTDEEAAAETNQNEWQFANTIKLEPVESANQIDSQPSSQLEAAPLNNAEMNEPIAPEAPPTLLPEDSLLELDQRVVGRDTLADDVFLDLEFEEQVGILKAAAAAEALTAQPGDGEAAVASEPSSLARTIIDSQEWPAVAPPALDRPPDGRVERAGSVDAPVATANLSAQAMDEIAEKVVQRLSDKVVREIAWEVVPELAELLIKKKLEEQK